MDVCDVCGGGWWLGPKKIGRKLSALAFGLRPLLSSARAVLWVGGCPAPLGPPASGGALCGLCCI